MDTNFLHKLQLRLQALAVFRPLLEDPVMEALCAYLACPAEDEARRISAYAAFVSRLYESGSGSLARHISCLTEYTETVYLRLLGSGGIPSAAMEKSVEQELKTLQLFADLCPAELQAGLASHGFLPGFEVEKLNLAAAFAERRGNLSRYGYGPYARYRAFCLDDGGCLTPVRHPDSISLDSLVGYERERGLILENTKALLAGRPAANILLTGDAGTGKSSTVKAVVNALAEQGLRIVEVRKEQLFRLPVLLEELAENPLRFIVFIDDLSFGGSDEHFGAFKALLEGSVSAKPANVAIYATSNRRHIVKERFSDREGDEIHRNDSMQELISLSARFGLHITFSKPDKQSYLQIVHYMAEAAGLLVDETLDSRAEQFALAGGGRSPRIARQFIDGLRARGK